MRCQYCETLIEQGDESHEDEEHNTMCDNCYHDQNGHIRCDECDEWIEDEPKAYVDEDSMTFCNEECQISYYSGYLSHLADIAKNKKYEEALKNE